MIVLASTTDKIEIKLNGAVATTQPNCFANYRDITNTLYVPGRNVVLTNGATRVDLIPEPPVSTQRVVDYISVFNADTANVVVTIEYNANGTRYILFVCTLGINEKLEYAEGQGFRVFANSGAIKNTINQGSNASSSAFSATVLGSDVINNNAIANTIQDVTGLSFPVTAGKKYYFKFVIQYTAQATTTGSRWSISGPTATMRYISQYSLTTASYTVNEGISAYDLPAASNATSASTVSNQAIIEGFIEPTANGTVIARFASEVLNSAITAKAGSVVYYQEVL